MATNVGEALAVNEGPTYLPPARRPIPIDDPVLQEENKGLWRGFFTRIKEDPNFRQAVMQTGLAMMQSPKMGENAFDQVSKGLGTGAATLDMLRQRDLTQGIEASERTRKADLEERGAKVSEKNVDIYGRSTTQQGEAAAETARREAEKLAFEKGQYPTEAAFKEREVASGEKMAEAALRRANRDFSGSQTGMVELTDILAQDYIAKGDDRVSAYAKAAREVMTTGKSSPYGDLMRYVQSRVEDDFLNGVESTPERRMQHVREALSIYNIVSPKPQPGPTGPPAPAVPPTPAGESGPTQRRPANLAKHPGIERWISRQVAGGVSPEVIHAALLEKGVNPAAYGY